MKLFGSEISINAIIIFLLLLALLIILIICYRRSRNKDVKLQRILDELYNVHPRLRFLDIRAKTHCNLNESYTENKKIIYVCICDSDGEYYSDNKLKQVILHELAHALSVHVDEEHKSLEFNTIYNSLMEKAEVMGIINIDHINNGVYYPDGRKKKFNTENVEEEEVENLEDIIAESQKLTKEEEMTKELLNKEDNTVKIKEEFNGEIEDEEEEAEEDAGESDLNGFDE